MLHDDNYVGDLWEDQAVPIAETDLIAVGVSLLSEGQRKKNCLYLTSSIIASLFHTDKNNKNKMGSAVTVSDLEKNNTLCQEKCPQN